MPDPVRLIATPTGTSGEVRFQVVFAAHAREAFPDSAAATLSTGDGQTYEVGQLSAPTAVTWREQRAVDLPLHRYAGPGPYTAHLRWGTSDVRAVTLPHARLPLPAAFIPPSVTLFSIHPVARDQFRLRVNVRVHGTAAQYSVRLDGGAGQVHTSAAVEGHAAQVVDLEYAKPGSYTVTLEALDADGFWLATLAEAPVDVSVTEEPAAVAPAAARAAPIVATASSGPQAWLPYRNIYPKRGTSTYTRPGSGAVSRAVSTGHWLSARAETVAGGRRWFQTAYGDWIAADVVSFFLPSPFQGVVLDATPPPVPPPPPPGTRRGTVTAVLLNVRAAPGAGASNPPVATLRAGTEVTIYAETVVAGAPWYRIAQDRWVHGAYVRIDTEPAPPAPGTRRGIVTASVVNVRAAPGISPTNPPIATLRAGTEVIVYEERLAAGEPWYRIGERRWVSGAWVRLLDTASRRVAQAGDPAPSPSQLPFGWVIADALNVRRQPSLNANNPPIGQLSHYAQVALLEERSVAGVRWFRIGEDQWIEGRWVGAARARTRPASIGTGAHWVGVNLSEQTLVAYEGDRPVYAALVASGLSGTPTVQGIFRTWRRLDTGKMTGPGYDIEDVTWTCYFYSGYALHTAYWHDRFGTPRSHGCVNLSPYDAWWIYQWSAPGGPNSPMVYSYWR